MGINTSGRAELATAINILVVRRGNTADPAEKDTINAAIDQLMGAVQDLDQADLLTAAKVVAGAADALEKVVASARLGPFDTFLSDIQASIQRLQSVQRALHAAEALPPAAIDPAGATAMASPAAATHATPTAAAAPTAAALAAPAPVGPAPASPTASPTPTKTLSSTQFEDLRAEYGTLFEQCVVRPAFQDAVDFHVSRLMKFQAVYDDVGRGMAIPWFFIGALHAMESGFDFGTHLHNGDPLSARTVHVPAGRPVAGAPPFTWRDSARDAMIFEGYAQQTDWSIERVLFRLEKYNGMGYRSIGIPSPYLWSFSNIYSKGRFVADHEFDPDAVSKQCGAAVMLKALLSL